MLQAAWAALVDRYPPFVFLTAGVFLVHEASWLAFNGFYTCLQFADIPFFEKYRIQKGAKYDRQTTLRSIRHVLSTQFFVILPVTVLHPLISYCIKSLAKEQPIFDVQNLLSFGAEDVSRELPSWQTVLFQVFLCQVIEDFVFYFSHRLLHTKYLYKRIHKVHHQHKAPFSWAAEYAHPLEMFFSNILPMVIGPMLLRSHIFTFYSWIALRIYYTTEVHSGYCFPWCMENVLGWIYAGPRHHDRHHEVFKGNYSSTLTYLDYLFGTTCDRLSPSKPKTT
ncbi:Methylsterol monooxygenase 2-2 [Balamuthia mandrillaris]